MRDVVKGTIQDKRIGATDDIQTATLDRRQVEYLYSDNEGHILMDMETYDQDTIPKEVFGEDILLLKPNTPLTAMFHEGKIVSYEMPKTVDLKVKETAPGIKGATATNQMKDAEMETGLRHPRAPIHRNWGNYPHQYRDTAVSQPGVNGAFLGSPVPLQSSACLAGFGAWQY